LAKLHRSRVGRVGVAVTPRKQHVIDVNSFANQLLDRKISPKDQPPTCVLERREVGKRWINGHSSYEDFGFRSEPRRFSGGKTGFHFADKDITSYRQLKSTNFVFNRYKQGKIKNDVFMRRVNGSPRNPIWATPVLFKPISNWTNLLQYEFESDSFFNGDHRKGSVDNAKDDLVSHSSRLLKTDLGSF